MKTWTMANNRDKCKIASDKVLATLNDNLKALFSLYEEFWNREPEEQFDINLQARLVALASAAAEKLLLLNIYSRNPLLLLPNITKEVFLEDMTYSKYDEEWLYEQSSKFIGPLEQWNLLEKFIPSENFKHIDELKSDFNYIKSIRNKYLHVYINRIAPRTFYLIKSFVLVLIIRLLKNLPEDIQPDAKEFLIESGLEENKFDELLELDEAGLIQKVIQTFPRMVDKLASAKNVEKKRSIILSELYTDEYLKTETTDYDLEGAPISFKSPEGEEVTSMSSNEDKILSDEIELTCPKCERDKGETNTAFLLAHVEDVHHHQDSEGVFETWNEPVDADIHFDHYYCISCGFYTDDFYLMEKLGFQEILEKRYWFSWDINIGAGAVELARRDGNGVELTAY